MAAKTNWHRYGTKLRHCHSMYSEVRDRSDSRNATLTQAKHASQREQLVCVACVAFGWKPPFQRLCSVLRYCASLCDAMSPCNAYRGTARRHVDTDSNPDLDLGLDSDPNAPCFLYNSSYSVL